MNKRLYNGNISQTLWRTANIDGSLKDYEYSYDALNRITGAIENTGNYNLTNVAYDKNGNITSLNRKGHINTAATLFGNMDLLVYGYEANSNKLKKVTDTSGKTQGFKDGANQTTEYTYDTNGNMITDANKGITSILYNHLNLPTEIKFDNSNTKKINYTYSADGLKLKKVVNDDGNITTTDYANGYVYENNTLQFFNTPEGYVNNDNGTFKYVYQYKDHLGNVRLSYHDSNGDGSVDQTEIVEENNYYPFGLKMAGFNNVVTSTNPAQKYKYNDREFQDELGLNMYDLKARQYDPALGRFVTIDPLTDANEQLDKSNYAYAWNDPIKYNDPDGECPSCIWGAIIGAAVDYGLQVAVNYSEGKSGSEAWTDVNLTSIAVSAGAGALSGGISSLKQVKNAGTLAKIGIGIATDTGISVTSQGINKGEVSLKDTAIDVATGGIATGVGGMVEKKLLNSSTGKKMAEAINAEKNVARGKSNVVPKNKADVKGATNKLETYVGIRAAASGAVSSGAASTAYKKIEENKNRREEKKKNNR